MVHQLSRAVRNIRNEDKQGHGGQKSKVDKQPKQKTHVTRHEGKIALHYLNKDIGDQDYGTLIEERTKFAEEKLFGDP